MMTPDPAERLAEALALHQQGQLAVAEPIYRDLITRVPDNADALSLLGTVCLQTGRDDEAVGLLERAISLKPDEAGWLANLGLVLRKLERYAEGAEALQRSLALKPDTAETLNNLGMVQHQLGEFEAAIGSFERAMTLRPELPGPHVNLAATYLHLKKYEAAADCLQQAIKLQPRHVVAHINLGMVFIKSGLPQQAEPPLRKALDLNPKSAQALRGLAIALRDLGRMEESLQTSERAIELEPSNVEARQVQLFLENYLGKGSPAVARARAEDVGRLIVRDRTAVFTNSRDMDRRIRVGFVSADFRQHPVAQFFGHLLPLFDRDRIETVLYANLSKVDRIGRRIRDTADGWRQIPGMTDEDLVSLIRQDGIDILIDLSGHTGGNKMSLFGLRAAPVQAGWLGYSGTTGLGTMDFIIVDDVIVPKDHEPNYSETAIRLPEVYLCYSPPQFSGLTAPVAPTPALENGFVTFGSYNNLNKTSDLTVECWAKVLRAVPNSRLLLKAGPLREAGIRDATVSRYAAFGIDADRLILKKSTGSTHQHFESYGKMDIALDPFPYNGTTTTCDALWMGVPPITLVGDRFISRVGASLVRTVGLGDLAAESVEEYVEIARRLAGDVPRLKAIRSGLRADMMASPLGDAPRFARDLETVFRQMWRRWCAEAA